MHSKIHEASGEFYPANIGLLAPGGPNDYELLVVGSNGSGESQPKVLEILINHGARLLSTTSYLDSTRTMFTMAICADFSHIDCTIDSLQIRIRKLKFVNTSLASSMKGLLFSSFPFPLTTLDKYRIVALGSTRMMELVKRLGESMGTAGRKALTEEGRIFALDIVTEIRNVLPEATNTALIQNMKAFLRATGWGGFSMEMQNRIGRVTVVYPPTFNGEVVSGVDFIDGIAEVVCELTNGGTRMAVYRETYDKFNLTLTLNLVEKAMVQKLKERKLEEKMERKRLELNLEHKALDELDTVIDSLEKMEKVTSKISPMEEIEESSVITKEAE
ncbi:MAG TPA: hypothetical protein VJN71_04445 [Nitrososphaerales archaeon]|nr:hypothetical protein [Nitrososphaerales archaeon]